MTETIWRKSFRNAMKETTRTKGNNKKMRTTNNLQIPGSLLGRFKAESKGYRPDILSYNAKTIQLTKFSAERCLADTEEGDENEKRFISSFNSSEAQASTSQRRPLGNFPLLW